MILIVEMKYESLPSEVIIFLWCWLVFDQVFISLDDMKRKKVACQCLCSHTCKRQWLFREFVPFLKFDSLNGDVIL